MALPIVNAGLAIMAKRMQTQAGESSPAQPEPKYMGWGTSTTAAALTDTALGAAASEARTASTSSVVTTNVTNDTTQWVGTITCAGAGKTISEMGLFDASSAGNMLSHWVFTGLALNVGDSIQFTAQVYGQ